MEDKPSLTSHAMTRVRAYLHRSQKYMQCLDEGQPSCVLQGYGIAAMRVVGVPHLPLCNGGPVLEIGDVPHKCWTDPEVVPSPVISSFQTFCRGTTSPRPSIQIAMTLYYVYTKLEGLCQTSSSLETATCCVGRLHNCWSCAVAARAIMLAWSFKNFKPAIGLTMSV
eukprot:3363621-Amphidinium_carterae.4